MSARIEKKLLVKYKEEELIRSFKHEKFPLWTWNYTEHCMYKVRNWDYVTKMCRGLVTDTDGNIIAKPFEKFFNVNEHENIRESELPDLPFEATEKVDGSLILVYWYRAADCLMVHTRGVFDNEQAQKAREYIYANMDIDAIEKYTKGLDNTLLFEVTYYGNGVVDYGEDTKLTLIGCVNNETFYDCFHDELLVIGNEIKSYVVKRYTNMDLADIVKYNGETEGFVIRFSNGLRVKVKTEWYRAVFRCKHFWNPKKILEMIIENNGALDVLAGVFSEQEKQMISEFVEYYNVQYISIESQGKKCVDFIRYNRYNRKQAAQYIYENYKDIASVCFSMLDTLDSPKEKKRDRYKIVIWKHLYKELKEG